VPEIPSPKHHEIQAFGQNYHISTMKFSTFTYSTALLQVHYNISFEVMSQRFIDDNIFNILMEQGCASIKNQVLKNKHFVDFHSRNMVIFSKFLDIVIFGTGNLGQNGEKFKKFYHLHKPSYMPYIPWKK
jgi:hypothetical protein